jgi:glycosyltransferase involved in cell wall biosynthesis
MKHLIVIPAYNEEEALPQTIAGLQTLPDCFELLVVNDGSRDRTGAVAEKLARTSRLAMHVVHLPLNGGIGVAVQTGYLFAARRQCYHYVLQFDADGQHEAAAIPALVAACEADGLDLCVGSRFRSPTADAFRSTRLRRLGIRFFARLISLLSGVRVTDPTSGLRCAGPRAWQRFARDYPEDYPEPESLFWCVRNKLRVGEIPVRMHDRQGGVSSIRSLRIAYYMVKVTGAILLDRLRAKEERACSVPND